MAYFFTSESVSEGHPDKVADQISDAILDNFLAQAPESKVACETLVTTGQVVLAGEVKSSAYVDVQTVARNVIKRIGYTKSEYKFEAHSCGVFSAIHEQSADINRGVEREDPYNQGAGDQGLMFGYASNETEVLMPAPIEYAHRLMERQSKLRRSGELSWLRPDAKAQVTLKYANGIPSAIDAVVLSTQHDPDVSQADLHEAVMESIIKQVIPAELLHKDTRYHINPTGKFVIGGPVGDAGLTGRKIIVDTYGGMARHGGGAFSGKDPSKVDRSAAYAGRYVAKNIVAAGLAERCEVQISYAIGVAEPTSIAVNTFGTAKVNREVIIELIRTHFDLRPYGITHMLNLLQPMYQQTATYGHFGREGSETAFTWEKIDKADLLRADANI